MPDELPERRLLRAGTRGLVGAMAMTGVRTFTAAIGSQEKSPPQAIVDEEGPDVVQRLPPHQRQALTELMHWSYGGGGGVLFGLLPERVRSHPAAGPAYGVALWLGFELVLAPVLGVRHARRHEVAWRAAVLLDHLVYGVVVAGRMAPDPQVTAPGRRRR